MSKLFYLRIALVVIGLVSIFGIFLLMKYWPSGWQWDPPQYKYEQMIVGIYATLGVFLILAARNPLANLSLIWFTVWSSVVHGGVMAVQALTQAQHHGHLWGDVPVLFLMAAVLAALAPRRQRAG